MSASSASSNGSSSSYLDCFCCGIYYGSGPTPRGASVRQTSSTRLGPDQLTTSSGEREKLNQVPDPGTVEKGLVIAKMRKEDVAWAYELQPE